MYLYRFLIAMYVYRLMPLPIFRQWCAGNGW